jgi:hypothetical protein
MGLAPAAGSRVWDLTGTVVYAGFIDPHLALGAKKPPVDTSESESDRGNLTSGAPRFFGVPGQESDPGRPGPSHGLKDISPERRVADDLSPDGKVLSELREIGFTAANVVPTTGLLRGRAAAIQLGSTSPNEAILAAETTRHAAFAPTPGDEAYPNSLMGGIAAIRQALLDAKWYVADHADHAARPDRRPRPGDDPEPTAVGRRAKPGEFLRSVPGTRRGAVPPDPVLTRVSGRRAQLRRCRPVRDVRP